MAEFREGLGFGPHSCDLDLKAGNWGSGLGFGLSCCGLGLEAWILALRLGFLP